ncbi:MAG: hypothetical protein K6G53_06945 [Bacteroidales bacterium]|nr:hypothetical protein [Bacteroidales bacterium]
MELKFNYSQDIIDLQTKYSLFKRVLNILFSLTIDGGFDKELMTRSINLLIERNDCLRIRFFKKGKETLQTIDAERKAGDIPVVRFDSISSMDAFMKRFRKKPTDAFKGRVLEPVYVTDPSGAEMVLFKISHMVADTYGIGVLVNDLMGIYNALRNGTELPAAPGSFETVLKKDNEYRSDEAATRKDYEFFKDYYENRHSKAPMYCGIHGDANDRWLKFKRKGNIALPYLMIRCDTQEYRFVIPAAISRLARKWCEDNSVTMNSFFFYTCAIAASLKNGRAPYQLPLELLNCRGTVADRRAAGTKVQSLSVYTTVDYSRSFNENIADFYADQNELYRHTRLSYLEVEAMQHKLWKYSMLSQITNFCFSFIPMATPEGVTMQVYSNGKGALVTYMALIHDVNTDEIQVSYDVQTRMVTPEQLIEFHNCYIHVIEAALANPTAKLSDIL